MPASNLYTDRVNGPAARVHEELPSTTSDGLFALLKNKIQSHWLAHQFPEHCIDGNGISGTNTADLWATVRAVVPELKWPLWMETTQEDDVLFDLIEFLAPRVAKPTHGDWHSFPKHYELKFDEKAGRQEFSAEVNQLLHRGGTVYELDANLEIVRLGTPAVQQVVGSMAPDTGDKTLDALLAQAKKLYQSRDGAQRALALEKLWDGFERLKTIDVQGNKKVSVEALLNHITSPDFRAFANIEMKALTDFGNAFMIRHHETGKSPVPPEAHDYLFARMGSLIVFLLKESGRLGQI